MMDILRVYLSTTVCTPCISPGILSHFSAVASTLLSQIKLQVRDKIDNQNDNIPRIDNFSVITTAYTKSSITP